MEFVLHDEEKQKTVPGSQQGESGFTSDGAVEDVLVLAGVSGDVGGGAPHVKANHLQLGVVLAVPLSGHGVPHVPGRGILSHAPTNKLGP